MNRKHGGITEVKKTNLENLDSSRIVKVNNLALDTSSDTHADSFDFAASVHNPSNNSHNNGRHLLLFDGNEKQLDLSNQLIEEASLGKVLLMRAICLVFGVGELQVNFHRNLFPTSIIRDILAHKIESSAGKFSIEILLKSLNEKVREFYSIYSQNTFHDSKIYAVAQNRCRI